MNIHYGKSIGDTLKTVVLSKTNSTLLIPALALTKFNIKNRNRVGFNKPFRFAIMGVVCTHFNKLYTKT